MMKISNEIKSSGLSLHYNKHKGGPEVNGLQRHNERIPGQKHSNENIDDSRTANNIILKKCDGTYVKKINQIIEDKRTSKRKIRKDAVKLVEATVQFSGTVLTLPEKEQEQVLRDSYEWLKNEFGEDNIVSAVIHKDETNMHLHFDFVPMKDGRLTARDVINKGTMHKQQAEFLKYQQDKHPEAFFERGGGEFKGLRQKDFEKVQAILKANKDEMKEYEKSLDDFSDELDEKSKNLDIREDNVKKTEAEQAEKSKNLDIRENKVKKTEAEQAEKSKNLDIRENKVKKTEAEQAEKSKTLDKRDDELGKKEFKAAKSIQIVRNYVNDKKKKAEKKENELNDREHDVEGREKAVEGREKAADDREEHLDYEVARRVAKATAERVKELDKREHKVEGREKAVEGREKAADDREKGLDDEVAQRTAERFAEATGMMTDAKRLKREAEEKEKSANKLLASFNNAKEFFEQRWNGILEAVRRGALRPDPLENFAKRHKRVKVDNGIDINKMVEDLEKQFKASENNNDQMTM